MSRLGDNSSYNTLSKLGKYAFVLDLQLLEINFIISKSCGFFLKNQNQVLLIVKKKKFD